MKADGSVDFDYTASTGEVWSPWRGLVKRSRLTSAQLDAREAFRSLKASRHAATHPGASSSPSVGPQADTADDANRVFDALRWAHARRPRHRETRIKWAKQKGVTLVLAKADFDGKGRAAPSGPTTSCWTWSRFA